MDFDEIIQAGLTEEMTFTVESTHTASHIGSGNGRVLATPWMIGMMEANSHRLLAKRLPEGYSSVGTVVNIRHLAPTPVGAQVRITSEVLSVEGLRVTLRVQAWDETELVGAGEHQRMIVDEARFLKRVKGKQEKPGLAAGS